MFVAAGGGARSAAKAAELLEETGVASAVAAVVSAAVPGAAASTAGAAELQEGAGWHHGVNYINLVVALLHGCKSSCQHCVLQGHWQPPVILKGKCPHLLELQSILMVHLRKSIPENHNKKRNFGKDFNKCLCRYCNNRHKFS